MTNVENLHVSGTYRGESFTREIVDSEVIHAMSLYGSPGEAVEVLLKIGACAALTAQTGFDMQAVRREMDDAVRSTTEAFTVLKAHLDEAVGQDGVIAEAMSAAKTALATTLQQAVATHADPDTPGSLAGKMQAATKAVDQILAKARTDITEEWRRVTEAQVERVEKQFREMRDLDPSSAMGRAFASLEQHMKDLTSAVEVRQGIEVVRQQGTAKGADYEAYIAGLIADIANVHGDSAEHTGNQQGQVVLKKGRSLRGDITCTTAEESRVVFECMNRAKSSITVKAVRAELDEAMKNRNAQSAVAIISSADNPLMCNQPFQLVGPNMWAVVVREEETCFIPLQTAYRLARHAAMATHDFTMTLDIERVRKGIEEFNQRLSALTEVRNQLANIGKCQDNATHALVLFERDIRAIANDLLASVAPDQAVA